MLTDMETNVRSDLKDLDASAYLWTTAELDRHIQHAVNDYQAICPRQLTTLLVAVADGRGATRRQSLSPRPSGYLWALGVEYPVDGDPAGWPRFREDPPGSGTLDLCGPGQPAAGEDLRIWYAAVHQLDNAASTIPPEHEEIIGRGAVAYAALAAARYTATRLNASSGTSRQLAAFARERMLPYRDELARLRATTANGGLAIPAWRDA